MLSTLFCCVLLSEGKYGNAQVNQETMPANTIGKNNRGSRAQSSKNMGQIYEHMQIYLIFVLEIDFTFHCR